MRRIPTKPASRRAWPGAGILVLVLIAQAALPGPAAGQEVDAETLRARRAAANTLLSLALPGTGQLRDGKRRGWAYLALEAVAWGAWGQRRHRAGVLRTEYRDLAWESGRIRSGARVDGDFPYYERLSTWPRSGAYDAGPDPGLQPETDPGSYNGYVWSLAAGQFLGGRPPDPGSDGYARALDYYRTRAYGEAFLWDWSTDPDAQARVADLIEQSDERFREATVVLGAVLANHLVSAVDAYLSTSLDLQPTSLRVAPGLNGPPGAWRISLHIGALP